jgi:predicted AlkP superfamily pyrophosphatase or phosphodiesterase
MINEGPLARFAPLGGGLLKPIYADYSFANIANTVEHLLTGEPRTPLLPADCFGGSYPRPRKVVTFFIDAFGWAFWKAHQQRFRTTSRVVSEGVLTPISALFPSTTAASVSTLNLGVPPSAHALYEWNIYIPAYGETIQSLAFSPLGRRYGRDACVERGYDPGKMLEVHETVHQRLGRHSVKSVQFSGSGYAGSAYNTVASAGAEVIVHGTMAEALVQLKTMLEQSQDKAWLGFYWASLDTIAHIYGPGTPFHAAEIASFWSTFDAVFRDVQSEETLYLFFADHGQVRVDMRNTIYINKRFPEVADCLAISPTGNVIYPNGSPRDMFLHVRPERRDDVFSTLQRGLDGMALVMTVDTALEQGLFGAGPISPELRRRLGDILVLPYADQFIWWQEHGVMGNAFNGHHGGLAPDELISALGVLQSL